MSNTATQQIGFKEASVQALPSLVCIGFVSEIGEGKLASTGNYVVQPFKIEGNTGTSRGITDRLLYRPEWLEQDYDPASMEEFEGGASMLTVYRKNIAVKGGISKLKGLSGSEENFSHLAATLLGLEDHNAPTVEHAFRNFFLGHKDADGDTMFVQVGYVLKQRRDKTGEDENGRGIYELAQGYEVGEYWFPTTENQKKMRLRAKRSKDGMFRIAFDEGDE